jgi:hypothetical protein
MHQPNGDLTGVSAANILVRSALIYLCEIMAASFSHRLILRSFEKNTRRPKGDLQEMTLPLAQTKASSVDNQG